MEKLTFFLFHRVEFITAILMFFRSLLCLDIRHVRTPAATGSFDYIYSNQSRVYIRNLQSQVRWLINGLQVDDQYEHNSGDVIENRLLWPSVQRSDLNSIFTCQALNTKLVEPKETSFVLDMNCEFEIEYLFFVLRFYLNRSRLSLVFGEDWMKYV